MKVRPTSLGGVLVVEPVIFGDSRGFFTETYQLERYRTAGIPCAFVQDNLSYSVKDTLRGLHYQIHRPQAKLVQVLMGEVFDVVVDVRRESPTFGRWEGFILSGENKHQLFIPEGFAHGFCVLSQTVLFSYKCSDYYVPEDEGGILWSDTDVGVQWPVTTPLISEKDQRLSLLQQIPDDRFPRIRSIS